MDGMSIPKFDADFNGPLVEVVVLFDADFPRAADVFHVVGEGGADLADEGVELGLPFVLQRLHHGVEFGFGGFQLVESVDEFFDLLASLLEFADHAAVAFVHELHARLLAFDLVVELLHRLAFGEGAEEGVTFFVSAFQLLLADLDQLCCGITQGEGLLGDAFQLRFFVF